jgi:hypothetical protein
MRRLGLIFFATLIFANIFFPFARADDANLTPNITPFITINPVGNHTVGDVFFISGTTNLPAGVPLIIFMNQPEYTPAGGGSFFTSTVPIQSGENGINLWSCSVSSTTQFWSCDGRCQRASPVAWPGMYYITVNPSYDSPKIYENASNTSFPIYLFPPATSTTPFSTQPAPLVTPNLMSTTIQTTSLRSFTIQSTTEIPASLTAQSTPLPIGLPIVALAVLGVMKFFFKTK